MSRRPDDGPLVSVVILNYNGGKFVKKCLTSVLDTQYGNLEVIFVDNASTDGSFELAKNLLNLRSRLTIIRNDRNMGFAEGNNVGFKYAKGNYVVFLNIDTEVDRNWLRELVMAAECDLKIGAAQSKLVQMYDHTQLDSIGQSIDFLGYGYPNNSEKDKVQLDNVKEIFYADGAAILIRRSALCESLMNGAPFDPDYFCYYEENDLCWRMRLCGYKIALVPHSVVYHARTSTNLHEMPQHLVFHHAKNRIMTLMKNYDVINLLKYIPCLLALEVARAGVLLKNDPRHSLAVLESFFWNVRNLKRTWKKRLIIQRLIRKRSDTDITSLMRKPNLVLLYENFKKYYTVRAY